MKTTTMIGIAVGVVGLWFFFDTPAKQKAAAAKAPPKPGARPSPGVPAPAPRKTISVGELARFSSWNVYDVNQAFISDPSARPAGFPTGAYAITNDTGPLDSSADQGSAPAWAAAKALFGQRIFMSPGPVWTDPTDSTLQAYAVMLDNAPPGFLEVVR